MKLRLISIFLLFATVFGLFGCTAVPAAENTDADNAKNSALLSGSALLNESASTNTTESLLNLAATDESGEPLFQIVYDIGADLRVQEQCEALAADIYDATGVVVPVVHSAMPQKKYELTVGEVKRSETIDVIDGFALEDNDFVICVIDTRVLIYAESETALVSAVIYFKEQAVQKSSLQTLYGIDKSFDFTYHPFDNPPVSLTAATDTHVDLTLEIGVSMKTYARLTYTGRSGWRLRTKYRESDEFREDGASQILAYSMGEYTLGTEDERFYTEKISVSQTGSVCTATAPDGSRAEIHLDVFRLDFFTPSGKLASSITNVSQNAGGTTVKGTLEPNEAIFGTGERFNSVNQRGKKIEMFSKDLWSRSDACYMVIPLLCSSRGSGFFINNYEHMVLDLDSASPRDHSKAGTWSVTVTGAPIDCYIYTTEKIGDVIQNYSALSGYASMPEEWTYGMLVCAYSPDLTQKWSSQITPSADGRGEGVYEMIANMEAYDLPWTGVLAEAWGPHTRQKQNDLKELCDYVHSLGKKFLVYMRVGYTVATMDGYSYSYLLTQTRMDGSKNHNLPNTSAGTNNPDLGTGVATFTYLDFTDPQAAEWFYYEWWDSLANDIGVDGCKIDFCEMLPENYKLNYFDENIPTAGSHHWYPTAFSAKFYDMISSKPDSGMCYTRGGGIGSQRSPYMWAGDQSREWSSLHLQLTAVLSSGLSGVPYMSYDMSGYQYGNSSVADIANESLIFLRGTQFTAYTVCIQTHGTVKRSYQFAEYTDAEGNHPYAYVTDVYRAYTKLHEHLTPYITELCEEASTTGMPVMRHLVLGWQDDTTVYRINDEYTFGDAFLIAPIHTNATSRSVYLPEGTWEDLNTGDVYVVGAEGLTITANASIAELPSYFNVNTESETARELVDGIKEIYDYARSLVPAPADAQ